MNALDRKLARDLWSLKTQVVSIALVIATLMIAAAYASVRGSLPVAARYASRLR